MSLEEAREHVETAKEQLERAQVDCWDPSDAASCVTNTFYAYENLIVAAAEAHNIAWRKNHYRKAELARELATKKIVTRDLHDELLRLNDLRKDVSYGEPGSELQDESLEDLVSDLEHMVDEVDSLVSTLEDEADENCEEEGQKEGEGE